MGAPDFESRRISRLHESTALGDPIEFPLFGRDWLCVPLIPFPFTQEISERLRQAAEQEDEIAVVMAMQELLRASIVNREEWDYELGRQFLDPDTLGEIGEWLAGEYGERWVKAFAARITEDPEPSNVVTFADKVAQARDAVEETPQQADRRHRARALSRMMMAGGEVTPGDDPESIATYQLALTIANSDDPELWDD